ncbi:MAG: hypothetical protein HRU09_16225 [Oligoflexales bacterium]|nr:hypothetical protein [Oligoflexales bacterium]
MIRRFEHKFKGTTVVESILSDSVFESEIYHNSPLFLVRSKRGRIEQSFPLEKSDNYFSIYEDLEKLGVTFHYGRELEFADGSINPISFASTRHGGLTDEHLELIDQIAPCIAACIEIFSQKRLTALVSIY